MKKQMMTAPALLLGLLLAGPTTGSAQMGTDNQSIGSQSSSGAISSSSQTSSDATSMFHIDRFEKRGRKIYAVGWFGPMGDTATYSMYRSGSSASSDAGSSMDYGYSYGGSYSSGYGSTGSSSAYSSGSFGTYGGSSFNSSSFGSGSIGYGTTGSSSSLQSSGNVSSSLGYYDTLGTGSSSAMQWDLPGDRVSGFGNSGTWDDVHEAHMGPGGSSTMDLDASAGVSGSVRQPLLDVQKNGPLVDLQTNGQAVTGIDLNAPRLDLRDTLVSLRDDMSPSTPVSYYDENGDLVTRDVSQLVEKDGMVAMPVTFLGASCDMIELSIGPSNESPTALRVGNPTSVGSSSVGPFIIQLTPVSTAQTVSDDGGEASLCMASRLINGNAARTAIVDHLNMLIGAPIQGPDRTDGTMR